MLVTVAVLSYLTEREDIRLADLFAGDQAVQLNDNLTVPAATIRRVFGGGSGALTVEDLPGAPSPDDLQTKVGETVAAVLIDAAADIPPNLHLPEAIDHSAGRSALAMMVRTSTGLADYRAAKKLSLSIFELTGWATHLWGRPFGLERNHRAGEDASPHRKSHVTRRLLAEIREARDQAVKQEK